MNQTARAKLDELLQREIPTLLPHEIAFLRARKSYLTKKQSAYFADIISTKPLRKAGKNASTKSKAKGKKTS